MPAGARNASIRVLTTVTLALCGWLGVASHAQAQIGTAIVVTTTADTEANDSACSLREAIIASNTNGIADFSAAGCSGLGIDSIRFALGSGTPTIDIGATPLPTITDRVTISGNTGGATRVVLNGPAGLTGLHVGPTAANSTLRFLVMQQFLRAVHLQGAGSVLISSYIGTDASGMSAVPNGTGVFIEGDNCSGQGFSGQWVDGHSNAHAASFASLQS
jgi:CSLREA domain-containing protein